MHQPGWLNIFRDCLCVVDVYRCLLHGGTRVSYDIITHNFNHNDQRLKLKKKKMAYILYFVLYTDKVWATNSSPQQPLHRFCTEAGFICSSGPQSAWRQALYCSEWSSVWMSLSCSSLRAFRDRHTPAQWEALQRIRKLGKHQERKIVPLLEGQ